MRGQPNLPELRGHSRVRLLVPSVAHEGHLARELAVDIHVHRVDVGCGGPLRRWGHSDRRPGRDGPERQGAVIILDYGGGGELRCVVVVEEASTVPGIHVGLDGDGPGGVDGGVGGARVGEEQSELPLRLPPELLPALVDRLPLVVEQHLLHEVEERLGPDAALLLVHRDFHDAAASRRSPARLEAPLDERHAVAPHAVVVQGDEPLLRDGENLASGDALHGVGLLRERDRHGAVRLLPVAGEHELQSVRAPLVRPKGILDVHPAFVRIGQQRPVVRVHEELQVDQVVAAAENGVVGHLVSVRGREDEGDSEELGDRVREGGHPAACTARLRRRFRLPLRQMPGRREGGGSGHGGRGGI